MDKPMLSQLLAALMQVLVVLVFAGAVWLVFGRKRETFLSYVGLRAAPAVSMIAALAAGIALTGVALWIPGTRALVSGPNTIVGEVVAQLGPNRAIGVLLIIAIFKTALAEEILFRGLIGKRLVHWLGFAIGNAIQALFFGSVHLLLFSSAQWRDQQSAIAISILIVITLGWVNGWLNERLGRGSIVPGWVAHASSNVIAYLTTSFFIL